MKGIFYFLMVVGASTVLGEAMIVDGTAAIVGKRLITIQEARFFRAIQRFKEENVDPLQIESNSELKMTVQKIMFEELVLHEMKHLQLELLARVEAEKDIEKRKRKREAQFNAILARFHKSEKDSVDLIFRSLNVEKFMGHKVETLTPIITDAEVEKYYNQNLTRFKGGELIILKPNIVSFLKKQRVEKGLEEWVGILKERYGAINYLEEKG